MNRLIITGNLTRDPELKHTPQGKAVVTFSVANNDNGPDNPCFIECEAWEKTANFIAQYFRKGSRILLEGRLTLDTWPDKLTGEKRSRHKLSVMRSEFMDKKADNPQPAPAPQYTGQTPQGVPIGQQQHPSPAPVYSQPAPQIPPAPVYNQPAPQFHPDPNQPVTPRPAPTQENFPGYSTPPAQPL